MNKAAPLHGSIKVFLLTWLFSAGLAHGQGFGLKWVESDVILDKDGKVQVSYAVRWSCRNANLHGFYFEGFQEDPLFDTKGAYALDDRNNRYPLEFKRLTVNKYDIVLAGGRAFSDGEITYFFRYVSDLQRSGNVTQTLAGDRRLAVFNWSPVQWDDSMEHQAVTVHYPVVMDPSRVGADAAAKLGFMTEKFVNQRYTIDYPTARNSKGTDVFTVRFFRKDLPSRYHFQIQTYLDASHFQLATMAPSKPWQGTGPYAKAPENFYLNRLFPGGVLGSFPMSRSHVLYVLWGAIILFGIFPVLIMTRKHNSMLTAQAGIASLNWDGTEWVPPAVQVGTFRIKGKIAKDLTPVEAGLLLELPINQLMALLIGNMERKGLVRIENPDPLKVLKADASARSDDPYENGLLGAITADGSIDQAFLIGAIRSIGTGLEQKTWDCDLDATKEYHKRRLDPSQSPANEEDGYYRRGMRRHLYPAQPFFDDRNAKADQVANSIASSAPDLGSTFSGFRTSTVCYEGPFMQNVCHDACHSACHDACHSACHSACHGACHGACVSSGH